MGEGTVERKSGVGFISGPSYSYSYSYSKSEPPLSPAE